MNNQAQLGIITLILLLGFILIGAVSASVLLTDNTTISEKDANKITTEVLDEICSYLQIKDIIGKYQIIQGEQQIQKIAILIKPLVTQDIDISHMTLQLTNGEQLRISFYNGYSGSIQSYPVFEHPLWNSIANGSFSILSTIDDDNSIVYSHLLNKNTDMAFILLKLPADMTIENSDTLTMTIFPSPGIGRTVILEPPLPVKNIVNLYE